MDKKEKSKNNNTTGKSFPLGVDEGTPSAPAAADALFSEAVASADESMAPPFGAAPEESPIVLPSDGAISSPVEELMTDVVSDHRRGAEENGTETGLVLPEEGASSEPFSLGSEENVPAPNEEEVTARLMKRRQRRKAAKRMRMFRAIEEGKDIRYRGPLSYRGLRILAWLSILLSQIGLLLSLGTKMDPALAERFDTLANVLPVFRSLMTPLFLTATFAIILNNSRSFRSLLILYGGFSLLVYAAFLLVHDRYVVGIAMKLLEVPRGEAVEAVDGFVSMLVENGSISFNVFLDLFFCTLFTFFVIYRPKRVFVGKKILFFRLLAVLPASYEIACIVLKALASVGKLTLPIYVFPLLTTKPPMTFLLFTVLTFFIKKREWLFRRHGKSHEQYRAFLKTNLNSLQFSAFVTIQFIVFAIADLLLLLILAVAISDQFALTADPISAAVDAVRSWGFGECVPLILAIPFIMLFSYTRSYKDRRIDIVINVIGVILLALIYFEAFYQFIVTQIGVIREAMP